MLAAEELATKVEELVRIERAAGPVPLDIVRYDLFVGVKNLGNVIEIGRKFRSDSRVARKMFYALYMQFESDFSAGLRPESYHFIERKGFSVFGADYFQVGIRIERISVKFFKLVFPTVENIDIEKYKTFPFFQPAFRMSPYIFYLKERYVGARSASIA